MSSKKLIPELRFPEFVKEWTMDELEQCLDYLQPTPFLVESTDYKNEYDIPVLTAGKSFILGYTNEKEGVYKENLPVIIFDDFTTASQFVDFPFKVKSSAMKILLSKNGNNIKFVYESMQTINYEVGVHKRHWISVFSNLKIALPSPLEQHRIASCLSSLDEVIAAHSQKLEALKDHKKGLMQNLFPQEGETVPKWRFKEFENDGEWKKKKLEDIAIKIQDGTHFSPKSFDTGDFLYITSKNVKNGYIELSNAQFISKEEHENIYKRCDVKQGDVLLTKDGTIGQACVNELSIPFSLLSSVAFIRLKPNYSNYFLYHILVSEIGQKEIDSQIAGQALKRVTLTKINNFTFPFPSVTEQQKIASCLSSLDALIAAQTEKIEQLKLHKKGLMQDLFPKIND